MGHHTLQVVRNLLYEPRVHKKGNNLGSHWTLHQLVSDLL